MADVVSVRDEVARLRRGVEELLAVAKVLGRLQASLDRIGAGNPYRIVPAAPAGILEREVTDGGMAKALDRANAKADPLTRELSCLTAVAHLSKSLGDVKRKRIKIEGRLADGAGSEGEEAAAGTLGKSMREVECAVGRKLAKALDMALGARHAAIAMLVKMDAHVLKSFPKGSAGLRTAALAHSSSELIGRLADAEAAMSRGELTPSGRRVKI